MEAPGISPDGLRARFGASHLPLGRSSRPSSTPVSHFEHVIEEPESRDYPYMLALRCRR